MDPIILAILNYLERQPKPFLLAGLVLMSLLLGVIDYLTLFEISFAFFYLLPVSIAAWIIGKRVGIFISFLSAVILLIANQLSGQKLSYWLFPYWNTLTRFGFFIIVNFLLSTLRKVLENEKKLSRTDFLTGAFNRKAFHESVATEILRTDRYKKTFTIVYIDLDNFKNINDQFGHSVGDDLLKSIVKVIECNIRVTDLLARLGGDEFALLLLETSPTAAQITVSRIQRELLKEMELNGWAVTFSIGVVSYLRSPPSVDDVIRLADELMYSVKNTGKNAIKYSVYQ